VLLASWLFPRATSARVKVWKPCGGKQRQGRTRMKPRNLRIRARRSMWDSTPGSREPCNPCVTCFSRGSTCAQQWTRSGIDLPRAQRNWSTNPHLRKPYSLARKLGSLAILASHGLSADVPLHRHLDRSVGAKRYAHNPKECWARLGTDSLAFIASTIRALMRPSISNMGSSSSLSSIVSLSVKKLRHKRNSRQRQ
jgi:hypothetical protein